jgi:hypothetical protein
MDEEPFDVDRTLNRHVGKGGPADRRIHQARGDKPHLAIPRTLAQAIRLTVLDAMNTGPCVPLVANGRWNVPLARRPPGWETWNIPEAEA